MNPSHPPRRSDTWCAATVSGIGRAMAAAEELAGADGSHAVWKHHLPRLRASVAACLLLALREHVHHEDWMPMAQITLYKAATPPLNALEAKQPLVDLMLAAERQGFPVDLEFVATAGGTLADPLRTFLRAHAADLLKAIMTYSDSTLRL